MAYSHNKQKYLKLKTLIGGSSSTKSDQGVKTIISNIEKELEVLNAQKTKQEELCGNQNIGDDEKNLNTTLLRSTNNRMMN